MNQSRFPKQKISKKERTKEWGEKCVDALIESSSFGYGHRKAIAEYYELYNGKLDIARYYSYVQNPLGSNRDERKSYPARIRNYNIIKPVVDLLTGEKSRRPENYTVISVNSDVTSEKEQVLKQKLVQLLQQQFVNRLNEMGVPTDLESQEVPSVEEFIQDFEKSYKDGRAKMGQEALDYIHYTQKLPQKFRKAFFDFLITGYVRTYKGVAFDNVEYDIVSPLFIDHEKTDEDYIEDCGWAVRYSTKTVAEIIDDFHDILTDEQIDELENSQADSRSVMNYLISDDKGSFNTIGGSVDVYHCVWKTFVKTGKLYYKDEFGFDQMMEVSEDYVTDEAEDVEWFWKQIVYQGYRIGKDMYLNIEPFPIQRYDGFNPSKVKLPYNGRSYSDRHANSVSIVSLGLPYQILYNIFHYRLELSIAKNKDKILLMEYNTVPRQHGWDEEDFMYHADAHSIGWVDTTAEGKNGRQTNFNQFQVLDMSLWNYISKQYELLNSIKDEWEESMGITRQRKGNIFASDGKSNTERAVFQSSVISEELFTKFEEFEECELNGLLDTSKWAWIDGINSSYINRDYRTAFLSLDPVQHANAKYGVFVTKSSVEMEKLDTLRQYGMNYASNTKNPQYLTEILNSNNFTKIKEKFDEMVQAEREYEQQAQEQAKEIEQMRMQELEAARAHVSEENEKDRNLKRELEAMKIDAMLFGQDINKNGVPDINEIEKRAFEREKFYEDIRLKREKEQEEKSIKNRELDLKEKEIESKERIAKVNRNRYSK
jgi:hypothetical protein